MLNSRIGELQPNRTMREEMNRVPSLREIKMRQLTIVHN